MSICKVLNFFVPPHSSAPGVRKSIKGKGAIGKTAIQRFSYFPPSSGLYSPTSFSMLLLFSKSLLKRCQSSLTLLLKVPLIRFKEVIMPEKHQPLFSIAYLRSVWDREYQEFKNSPEADALFTRLSHWASRHRQKETIAEATFIDLFFKQTWGYHASGEGEKDRGYTLFPQYPIKGAGQKGGTGKADIALGYFGQKNMAEIPQVLGEFKDDRSGLDTPQINRPNDRSPVDQCLDYLREARTGLISTILPTWALVTDMNEFRLYTYGNKSQYQRFVIEPNKGDLDISLLGDNEAAAFQRFLFLRCFHSQFLLTPITGGPSKMAQLLAEQITQEQTLENEFYLEYHTFREAIYQALRQNNPQYEKEGRLRCLVKFTQRLLDRCLFILFCEDMGRQLNFPQNILRDLLIELSGSKFYNSDAQDAWTAVKRLFTSMRDGTPFGSEGINRFNGGLFSEDAEMDALHLPNHIFCEHNQGQSPGRLLQFPRTLLYFAARYNFGTAEKGNGKTLGLTAMGRIFEQSITDLEVMEAHADGRESLTELTKRKRDGVYYTPEWVTFYIVEETVGARLAEIRKELGFDKFTDVTDQQIALYQTEARKSKIIGKYINALHLYSARLDDLKVVDPACGSGLFLIQAFKYLYQERQWIGNELMRLTGSRGLFDSHSAMRDVLAKNLYGVDINAESVELTRLALWLHTALPDRPLTSLDQNIRCGNSLIGSDFYRQMAINRDLFSEEDSERVNTFDWEKAFPEVFQRENPGFDCVIGNPPYVKLQHFRKLQEDVARYLLEAKRSDGKPMYASTQTGNFDLYLPFIERGIELLNSQGKMGFIAPNVWMVNEYGIGLRRKLKRTRRLDRWIDFKSFQVFEEAITYTALQFFSGCEHDRIRLVFASEGKEEIAVVKWQEVTEATFYHELPEKDSWILMPNSERILHAKLSSSCIRLDNYKLTKQIFQGLITSADYIYHLERIGPNRYLHKPQDAKEPVEVEIEDAIMHPLVSGPEAKRYQMPDTSTYLLFPYELHNGKVRLFTLKEMESRFPKAWLHLLHYEKILRCREGGKFNDDQWYRFGRNQNIDKQEIAKLCVAQTVPGMRVCYDSEGAFYFNNVRVNGIIPNDIEMGWCLLGFLNGPVCDFVFKRIAKVIEVNKYEANKQFIAPHPIPRVTDVEKAEVAAQAKKLQEIHTRRRDLILMIDKRLDSEQCENDFRDESWIWSDLKPIATLKKDAPNGLTGRDLTAWATNEREHRLTIHLDRITPMLRQGTRLTVVNEYGELKVLADGAPLIAGLYLSEDEAAFISVQWRQKIRQTNVTEKFDGKRLLNLLLKLRKTNNPAIPSQVIRIDADEQTLDAEIGAAEAQMNALTYRLYKLTDEEIRLIEQG